MDNISLNDEHISLLLKEGSLASTSIGYGLTLLRKADLQVKGNFYQAFFQLSIGMERIMKLIIISKYRAEKKSFPNNNYLKTYGHKLIKLYKEVSSYYKGDFDDPFQNSICSSILKVISDFALASRYYNLDILTSTKVKSEDPLKSWKQIHDEIIKKHKRKSQKTNSIHEKLLEIMDKNSVTIVYDENNQVINNYSDLHNRMDEIEYVQGYAVLYTLKIIEYLTVILEQIEMRGSLYPYLSEFFEYYRRSWQKPYEIRKKKNWIYP